MSSTKNLIFDLGGVLMNINYDKTKEAFKKLGFEDFENMYSMIKANGLFNKLETGYVTEPAFYEYILDLAAGKLSKEQVTNAWNAMLVSFREESLNYLEYLAGQYRLFLLSNTNSIHKRAFEFILKEQTGLDSLDVFFEKAYYSHQIGLRKPDAAIFEYVLKDAGILAVESFFIDDLSPNINTAQKMGFKTHLLLPGQKIEDIEYS